MAVPTLRDYQVRARNTSADSENKIHDDTVARQFGFRGGLVPGVTVYAYLTHPLVQALGTAWLERGTATVRFLAPVIEDEMVTITGTAAERDGGFEARLVLRNPENAVCAECTATLPAAPTAAPDTAAYPPAPLPADRPAASRESLAPGRQLGSPQVDYDAACAAEYIEKVGDALPLYRGVYGWVHPAFYLQQANRALSRNVVVSPWIHVGSAIVHLGGARVGAHLETRGRVASLWEKKGRDLVELDVLAVAGPEAQPVAHIRHTAIWRLAVRASA